jgi:uncharacterized delta-60 repeat protein
MNIKKMTFHRRMLELIIVILMLQPTLVNAAAGILYVSSTTGSVDPVLLLISTATNTVIGSISLALSGSSSPRNVAITPNGQYAYIPDFSSASCIYAVNLATNSVTTIPLSVQPQYAAITPNGQYVVVAASTKVFIISTATNTVVYTITLSAGFNACELVINPAGTYAYFVSNSLYGVLPVDITNPLSPVVGGTITIGSPTNAVWSIAMTSDGNTAYVVDASGNLYSLTNLRAYPTSPIISFPTSIGTGIPGGFILSQDNSTGYTVINNHCAVIQNIATSPSATNIGGTGFFYNYPAINQAGTFVYMPTTTGSVQIINTGTNTISTTISLAGYTPYGAALANNVTGILDPTFGNQGITLTPISRSDQLRQAVINSSDKTIITGITQTVGGSPATLCPSVLLAQYTANGVLDTTFNSSGIQTLLVGNRSEGYAVNLDASSNILVAGMAIQNNTTQMLLARYTTTGGLDTGFNSVGYNTLSVGSGAVANAVGVQSSSQSNKIIVGGCSVNGGSPNFTLARFTSAGALDTGAFGTNGITTTSIGNSSTINAIAIITAATNKDYIIAVGVADNNIAVARYTAAGVLDTTFGSSGIFQAAIPGASSTAAYDVILDSTSYIVIAGSALVSGSNESLLMRLTPDGALDISFNGTGYVLQNINGGSEYYSVTIQPTNGYILAGGYAIGTLTNQISLARYTPGGILDASYGTNGIILTTDGNIAYAAATNLQSTGYCVAAGMADGTVSIERYTS